MRMFVYGELCKPEVLLSVLGRVPPAGLALLEDHRRARDQPGGYFRVMVSPGARVAGMLLDHIERADLAALDVFEEVDAKAYDRVEVEVVAVATEERVRAWVYL